MRFYFAPMEGLTDSIYRRLHHTYFPGIDRYYTPFFSPTVHRSLTAREERELPIAKEGFPVIPQLLTKSWEDFLWMADVCMERGYPEVNLNLGCPSGTVVSKGKGSGMLANPDDLDAFLYEIYSRTHIPVSIKTRLGIQNPVEFERLLTIFNRYPIQELVIHPRVRKEFYNGRTHMEWFEFAQRNSKNPLCYNGDLCSLRDADAFSQVHPRINAIMIGRGLIRDPGMCSPGGTTAAQLENFYNNLLEEYLVCFGGSRNAMFRLKENWRYLICRFEGSEKLGKKLRKTTDLQEYKEITSEIFHCLPLNADWSPDWLNTKTGSL